MIELNKIITTTYEASGKIKEHICLYCGKHFKDNEKIGLIIPPSDIRNKYKIYKHNSFVHISEVEDFCNNVDSIDEYYSFTSTKKAKRESLTEEQKQRIDIFIKAAYNCGYHSYTMKNYGVICKKNGYSDKVSYNVFSDIIEYYNNRKGYLFSSMVDRQQETNVFNEFHKLLEDNIHSDYNALEVIGQCINESFKTVNDIMS